MKKIIFSFFIIVCIGCKQNSNPASVQSVEWNLGVYHGDMGGKNATFSLKKVGAIIPNPAPGDSIMGQIILDNDTSTYLFAGWGSTQGFDSTFHVKKVQVAYQGNEYFYNHHFFSPTLGDHFDLYLNKSLDSAVTNFNGNDFILTK